MSDERYLVAAMNENPNDPLPRGIYADWLDDQGRAEESQAVRTTGLVKDIDLPALLTDYDWSEVFGEGTGGQDRRLPARCRHRHHTSEANRRGRSDRGRQRRER